MKMLFTLGVLSGHLHAVVAFCGIIFTAVFIPETKGKSLKEIEDSFL